MKQLTKKRLTCLKCKANLSKVEVKVAGATRKAVISTMNLNAINAEWSNQFRKIYKVKKHSSEYDKNIPCGY